MHVNPVFKNGARRKRGSVRLALAFLAMLVPLAPPANLAAHGQPAPTALEPSASREVRSADAQGAPLRVTFMGVSTLLFNDGENAIMTDGFFSRPSPQALLRTLKPNQERITDALSNAGVTKLAAVMTAHSHFDHAMDAPQVARRTDALLIGSRSTANIARCMNFPDDRIRVIGGGETFTFGRFKITVIRSRHSPGSRLSNQLMGEIEKCPSRVQDYKEGGSYSYLIEHQGRRVFRLLVHASANYIPGFLRDVQADVIFLGVGRLGKQSDSFAQRYWQEVVLATRAKVIIPIHWDNFTRPLDKPLRRMPRPFDNVKGGMEIIERRARKDDVTVRTLSLFEPVDVSELYR